MKHLILQYYQAVYHYHLVRTSSSIVMIINDDGIYL